MEFLKKRPAAVLITIAVIILATLFSVHRTLGAKCGQVEDGFYDSVNLYLDNCAEAANGMFTVACNYPELEAETTALRTARNALLDTHDISEKYVAYGQLRAAVADLNDAIEQVELSEKAQRNLSGYNSTFDTAVNGVSKAGYNEAVWEFTRTTLDVFPTNFLAGVAGVSAPELFE
jgi:uncharacterized protein YoxC